MFLTGTPPNSSLISVKALPYQGQLLMEVVGQISQYIQPLG
jgi:hypothetical protein